MERKTVLGTILLLYCSYSSTFYREDQSTDPLPSHFKRMSIFIELKEMEGFAFSLVLILFVFCGGVSSGNGKRVDVSAIIYRLIGIF
jgi:hypothetical protein